MKYNSNNKPLVCMQTQSTCYKGTRKMIVKGILWHDTGANNPTLKRYVQPSDVKPSEDTYSKDEWLRILGKNTNGNDWNHIERQAGLNCWIGKLADGTITTVQTMPWDYRPWGCGSGSKGTCNDGWIQFEICQDSKSNKNYFDATYKEACEITAYLCKMFNIDPKGIVVHNGVTVPTILCHQDSYRLKLGSNHSDMYDWFNKYGKTMDDVRNDVASIMGAPTSTIKPSAPAANATSDVYKVVVSINKYSNAADAKAQRNSKGTMSVGTYYIFNKYPNGVNGMLNITTDKTGNSAGSWINPAENVLPKQEETTQNLYRVRSSWADSKSQKGAYASLENAKECCQKAGAGYSVFDNKGNVVYTYKKVATKSIEELAREVIAGKWGNGTDRKNRLEAAGYDYKKVQAKVDELLNKPTVTYFPKYTGSSSSIVTALNSLKITSSFAYRKQIANKNGIKLYVGTAKQNTQMLNLLKQGKLIKP